jgi:hypothetical protein
MTEQLISDYESNLEGLTKELDLLVELLREEREAIVEYDLKKITAIYKRKNDSLNKIQNIERNKDTATELLATHFGFKGRPSSNWIVEKITDPTIAERIKSRLSCLKSLAQAVQEFNESQRQYVARSLQDVRTSLSLLGQLRGKNTESYTRDGVIDNEKTTTINHSY